MHVLVRAVRNFDLIIDEENVGFVLQSAQPCLSERRIPSLVGKRGVSRRTDYGSIGEKTVASVGAMLCQLTKVSHSLEKECLLVRIKGFLVYMRQYGVVSKILTLQATPGLRAYLGRQSSGRSMRSNP